MKEPLIIEGDGYIDTLHVLSDPRQSHLKLLVSREYHRIAEKLDLAAEAAWVRLRRALQGGPIL